MRLGRARSSQGTSSDPGSAAGGRGQNEFATVGAPSTSPFMAGNRGMDSGAASAESADPAARLRPWGEGGQSSPGPIRCEFLRSVGPDGRLADAQKTAVATHRCAAFGDPLPLSLRQQELVCLQRVHVSCPRYVRGTLLAAEEQAKPQKEERARRRIPILTLAGVVLFLLALGILVTASLGLPPFAGSKPIAADRATSPTPSAVASPTTAPSTTTPSAAVTITPAPSATPRATPSATPSATTGASATPAASPSWPPGATASRMDLLVPCTDQANCYLYTVRSAAQNGSTVDDTVDGIAHYFGVSTSAIYSLNPWAAAGITPGQQLKIPPPTR